MLFSGNALYCIQISERWFAIRVIIANDVVNHSAVCFSVQPVVVLLEQPGETVVSRVHKQIQVLSRIIIAYCIGKV
jgi:hypothetical protein